MTMPYAKINSFTTVVSTQEIDPNVDFMDPAFVWVNISGVLCTDQSPVQPGCSYNGQIFTSLALDSFKRRISFSSDGINDFYSFQDINNLNVILSFPTGTPVSDAYTQINQTNVPTKQQAITYQMLAYRRDAQAYMESVYDSVTRKQMLNLYILAKLGDVPLINRAAYLQPALQWASAIASYSSVVAGLISAAPDAVSVFAITWDISGNVGAKPTATLFGALLINN